MVVMTPDTIALAICSREDTKNYTDALFSHMLSLVDPERGLEGIVVPSETRYATTLLFHDLDDIEVRAPKYFDCIPPSEEHVVEIWNTFSHLRECDGPGILVHCEAGISRSVAAAIIGLCAMGFKPEDAFRRVTFINEIGLPNRRMLRLAGEMMDDNGRLLRMAEKHRKFLFQKYSQFDPTEFLRAELDRKPFWRKWLDYARLLLTTRGNMASYGSDQKMWSRLQIKEGMQEQDA